MTLAVLPVVTIGYFTLRVWKGSNTNFPGGNFITKLILTIVTKVEESKAIGSNPAK
jgi:hypothetical protein